MPGVQLKGFNDLERKLVGLERKVGKGIVRKATRKAAKPAADQGKQNALSMVGGEMGTLISKNLHIRAFRKQKKGQYGVAVKLKPSIPGFTHIGKDGTRYYIPAAIEYGHENAMGIPFMRSASDMTKHKRVKILGVELAAGIKAVGKSG